MRRFEASKASLEKRTTRTLLEVNYLLRGNNEVRQGAIRFSQEPYKSLFLSPQTEAAIPPLIYLPQLVVSTDRFIQDDVCGCVNLAA